MDNDNKSVISDADSADTFKSWASNWSDCTNATFNKVHRYWRSNSALHKEVSFNLFCMKLLKLTFKLKIISDFVRSCCNY